MHIETIGDANLSDSMVKVVNSEGVATYLDFYPATVAFNEQDHAAFGITSAEFKAARKYLANALSLCILSVTKE